MFNNMYKFPSQNQNAALSSPCTLCTSRCCRDKPCLNGGTCRENCEATGKRFICDCPARFVGQLCEKGMK